MCGIYGGYWQGMLEVPEQRLAEAQRQLHHRGPDDRGLATFTVAGGTLALGHTRLSIIDLTPGGHQPMVSGDGRYTIVFNGEIYNYRELRQELRGMGHRFHTKSDTEVLLACWAQWGADCLSRLVGMFAFVLFNHEAQTLTLARDAFGIKPLYYSVSGNLVVFASELQALLVLRAKPNSLNVQRAYDYLVSGIPDLGFETFVKDVHQLPPAHLIRIDLRSGGQFTTARWWNPPIAQTSTLSFAAAAEAVRELFLDSMRMHLRSDVPLGLALSGGLDSSSIACVMRHLEPDLDIHTFSFIGEHGSVCEEPWIDIINNKIMAISHKVLIDEADFDHDLSDLIHTQGEPFGGTAMFAQYCIFKEARKNGITVLLEGQGGDELLAGYDGYPGQMMLSYMERNELCQMIKFGRQWKRWADRSSHSPWRALIGQLLPDNVYSLANTFLGRSPIPAWMQSSAFRQQGVDFHPIRPVKTSVAKGRRVMETLLQSLTISGLPHLMRYSDRNAMRFSIENRVPFLTLPLAELILTLPEHYLINKNGETKSIFRAAMRGLVPDAILDRRSKVGFDTPMRRWMSRSVLAELQNGRTINNQDNLICWQQVNSDSEKAFASQGPLNWQFWRIYNLMAWQHQFQVL
jgi:asparagine synthase (glutamine-hydrolysing)